MLLLLCVIFWLTISGANVPSQLLADGLFWIQDRLSDLFVFLHAPNWLHGALVLGVYRVLAWVVSVCCRLWPYFFLYSLFWKTWAISRGWLSIWTNISKKPVPAGNRL